MPGGMLICGVNWLGDALMSMPAIAACRAVRPGARPALLTRPALGGLWRMSGLVDDLHLMGRDAGSLFGAVRALRARAYQDAYVLPNSFRSALVPALAGIPRRVGVAAGLRRVLLTERVRHGTPVRAGHQSLEYYSILGLPVPPAPPRWAGLCPPESELAAWRARLPGAGPFVALVPGAARGTAKQWPAAHFGELGRLAVAECRARVLVLGTPAEEPVCAAVASAVGAEATNLAGATRLDGLAAVLALCRAAVTNDSGAMHLAGALGIPVVAVFGITDPAKTGPLGPRCRVVQAEGVRGSRRVPRESRTASAVLASITPRRVMDELAATWATGPVTP